MKLYAVTKGCYSDYHIITLTTSKTRAEHIAMMYSDNWGGARVEEYDEGDVNDTRVPYAVYFYKDASRSAYQHEFDEFELAKQNKVEDYTKSCSKFTHIVHVLAESNEHALKIASDRLAQYKAEKEGI